MANWSVKASASVIDPNNANNILVTFTATNSVTNEVVTQNSSSSNWTTIQAQAFAQTIINALNQRDAIRAVTNAALPGIQAFVAQNNVLATG